MQKDDIVIFDFDGVIVDSLDFSFNINKRYSPKLTREEWERMHLDNFYKEYQSTKNKIEMTIEQFYEEYEKEIYKIFPIKKMDKVIKSLYKSYEIVIVSGSPARIIDKYLRFYKLREYFSEILGTEYHLSKVEKLKKIKELYNLGKENCVLITDTLCDVKEGKEAGVSSIAVTWGIFDRKVFQKENPISIVDSPEELLTTINKLFRK